MSKSLIQLPNGQHVYVAWSEEATRIMYDPAASAQAVLEAYGSGKVYGVVESVMPAPETAGSKVGSTLSPLAAHLPLRMETPIPPELDGLLRRGAALKITPPEHTCTPTDNDLCPACEFNKNEARKEERVRKLEDI